MIEALTEEQTKLMDKMKVLLGHRKSSDHWVFQSVYFLLRRIPPNDGIQSNPYKDGFLQGFKKTKNQALNYWMTTDTDKFKALTEQFNRKWEYIKLQMSKDFDVKHMPEVPAKRAFMRARNFLIDLELNEGDTLTDYLQVMLKCIKARKLGEFVGGGFEYKIFDLGEERGTKAAEEVIRRLTTIHEPARVETQVLFPSVTC